jgi:hypothetical protein
MNTDSSRADGLTSQDLRDGLSPYPDLTKIKAPHPRPAPEPWQPPENAPKPAPILPNGVQPRLDRVVRCIVLKPHLQGNAWHDVGSHYDAPDVSVAARVAIGQIRIDPAAECSWFEDPPEPAGTKRYDNSLGPDCTVLAKEENLPVSFPKGCLWFSRDFPGIFWVPTANGESKVFPEAVAILLERTGTCTIVGPLTERGKRFAEGLQKKRFNNWY